MRIVQLATHEFGHMLGLGHCTLYQCLMMGINHLEQSDRSPVYFCPACYRKIWKCLKFDHVKRYEALMKVCKEFGGVFEEPHEEQINQLSPYDWFNTRHTDLKATITPEDYSGIQTGSLAMPGVAGDTLRAAGKTTALQRQRASSAQKQTSFLKKGSGGWGRNRSSSANKNKNDGRWR